MERNGAKVLELLLQEQTPVQKNVLEPTLEHVFLFTHYFQIVRR